MKIENINIKATIDKLKKFLAEEKNISSSIFIVLIINNGIWNNIVSDVGEHKKIVRISNIG